MRTACSPQLAASCTTTSASSTRRCRSSEPLTPPPARRLPRRSSETRPAGPTFRRRRSSGTNRDNLLPDPKAETPQRVRTRYGVTISKRVGLGRVELPTSRLSGSYICPTTPTFCRTDQLVKSLTDNQFMVRRPKPPAGSRRQRCRAFQAPTDSITDSMRLTPSARHAATTPRLPVARGLTRAPVCCFRAGSRTGHHTGRW